MVLQDRAWQAVAVWDSPTCNAMTEVGQSIPEECPSVSNTAPENMQQGWKWLAKGCGAVHRCEVRAAVELMACRLLFHPPFLSKPTKRSRRLLDYGMHGMVAASGPPQSPFHVPERAGRRGILWPRNVLDELSRPEQQAACHGQSLVCSSFVFDFGFFSLLVAVFSSERRDSLVIYLIPTPLLNIRIMDLYCRDKTVDRACRRGPWAAEVECLVLEDK